MSIPLYGGGVASRLTFVFLLISLPACEGSGVKGEYHWMAPLSRGPSKKEENCNYIVTA
jgi:hypothetical protein